MSFPSPPHARAYAVDANIVEEPEEPSSDTKSEVREVGIMEKQEAKGGNPADR